MAAAKGTRPPNAGKGRKAGIPNKFTSALKDALLEAARLVGEKMPDAGDVGGLVAFLMRLAKDHPAVFAQLLGKVLPLQVGGPNGEPLKKLVIEWRE